jgi:type II secretory pathway component HofQ
VRLLLPFLFACGGAEPVVAAPPSTPERTTQTEATVVEEQQDQPIMRFESRTIGATTSAPRYTGRPIDLDLKDANIGNVCRLIADVGRVNIVLGDGVQGSVTMTIRRVPWDQALDAVIQAKGLRAEREGNVILLFAK